LRIDQSPNSYLPLSLELWWQRWKTEVAPDFAWLVVEPVECLAEIPAAAPWLRQPSQSTSQRRPLLRNAFVAFCKHTFQQNGMLQ
jgi:hypothetical protein